MTSTVAYVSTRCPNCTRFLESVRTIPSLQHSLRVVDIDQSPNPSIQYVPTVVDAKGSMLVGQKAFEWLKQFQSEVSYQSMPLSMGSLSYGDLTSGGSTQYADGTFSL